MVYCGKPSGGCSECRKRKTRCDRATPSCTQCIRAHRTCSGYRNQLDLMFRNESDTVKEKAAKSKEISRPKSTRTIESHPQNLAYGHDDDSIQGNEVAKYSKTHLTNTETLCIKNMMPNYSMFPTLEERSLAFFGGMAPTWFRTFDLVDTICRNQDIEEHLQASMSAVGLASFSNASHAPELMAKAQKDYGKALQLTNEALRSPTAVKKDSTLFSVMVLSIYEMITGNNERSLDSWAEHIKGAAALVKLRGAEQFRSAAGQRMFLQVTSSLMLSCIQRTISMPDHIIELRDEAAKYMDIDSPAWRLSGIIIDFTIFRSEVGDCKVVGPRDVIKEALDIDQRFIHEFENLPEEWKYETVYTTENPHLVWNGNYHVYREYWMSHIWNGMRTCRILLHEMIRDQLLAASTAITLLFTDDENAMQLNASIKIMLEMQTEILASVPHHTPSLLNQSSSGLLDGSRSYFVLWPLFLVGSMDLTTETIRTWAAARLEDIGRTVGIRQAMVISNILTRRALPIRWNRKPTPRLVPHQEQINRDWSGDENCEMFTSKTLQ
ncbi:hypothetical protein BKA65DRAFT_484099 [Rhexocercosporidium sp. MPI-PUGE-AT-0058]|nr:hypothetical protein BKA65DRAFT_484099 [Rhexocercosporidium sp. MPI-PUGE-AT-0058]